MSAAITFTLQRTVFFVNFFLAAVRSSAFTVVRPSDLPLIIKDDAVLPYTMATVRSFVETFLIFHPSVLFLSVMRFAWPVFSVLNEVRRLTYGSAAFTGSGRAAGKTEAATAAASMMAAVFFTQPFLDFIFPKSIIPLLIYVVMYQFYFTKTGNLGKRFSTICIFLGTDCRPNIIKMGLPH